MLEFSHIDWATPWGALLLLAPLLLAALAWRRRQKLAAWADAALLPWAVASQGSPRREWRRAVDAVAWVLLALAAAGPRLPQDDAAMPESPSGARHVMSVMVALDISASMAASDIAPNRLSRARLELADLARRLKGERIGLMLYAGRAGVLLPPTDDTALFVRALDQVGPDLIEAPGTHVAAALDLAMLALGKENPGRGGSRAVLLLTDAETDSLAGAALDAAKGAAARLKAARIPLFVLALSTTAGAAVPLPDGAGGGWAEREGAQVVSRPDAPGYAELAQISGGRYVAVSDGDGDWDSLYDQGIARLPGEGTDPGRVRAWQPLFAWPLALALALFVAAHLPRNLARRALPAAVLLLSFAISPAQEAQASQANAGPAFHAYQAERWGEAAAHYSKLGGYVGQMGAGAAAWKLKDYGAAARHFSAALLLANNLPQRADALYNLGNANYALTRWQVAAEAWRAVLLMRPHDDNAAGNLVRAENQLKKRRDLKPMKTDLRLRPGISAEGGELNLDWNREGSVEEFERTPGGPQVDRGAASGAMLSGEQAAAQRTRGAELDARRLQSGLSKLERLEERPRTLIKGLLKQDTPPDAASLDLPPW